MTERHDRAFAARVAEYIPRWLSEGVLDEAGADGLRAWCGRQAAVPGSRDRYVAAVLAAIGAALTGAGFILLVNYNWEALGRFWQLVIALLPVFIAGGVGVVTLYRSAGQGWRGASALLTGAGAVTSCAVISQIYNLEGDLCDFITLVLGITLPLIYIFRPVLFAFLFAAGGFFAVGNWWGVVFALGAAPFFISGMIRGGGRLRWWSGLMVLVCFGVFSAQIGHSLRHMEPGLALILGLLPLLASLVILPSAKVEIGNPLFNIPFVYLLVFLAVGSIEEGALNLHCDVPTALLITAAWVLTAAAALRRRNLACLPAAAVLAAVMAAGLSRMAGQTLVCAALLLISGILLLIMGCRRNRMSVFNCGLMCLAAVVTARFFDDRIGLIVRGMGFIVCGLAFIAANLIFVRHRKRAAAGAEEVSHE